MSVNDPQITKKINDLKNQQIFDLFDESAVKLKKISAKISELKNKAATSEQEAYYAQNVEFKHWYGNDTTKAVEYLQKACVALSESQISTKEALEFLYDYQKTAAEMMNKLIIACGNNRCNVNELQKYIDEYLELQNEINDDVEKMVVKNIMPTIMHLRARLEEDNQRLEQIENLNNKIVKVQNSLIDEKNIVRNLTSKLENIKTDIAYQNQRVVECFNNKLDIVNADLDNQNQFVRELNSKLNNAQTGLARLNGIVNSAADQGVPIGTILSVAAIVLSLAVAFGFRF